MHSVMGNHNRWNNKDRYEIEGDCNGKTCENIVNTSQEANDSDIEDDSMLHYMDKVENNNDDEAGDDLKMDTSDSKPLPKRS
ncbi:hypothetical protein FQA39_LY04657 [Lamprigera yunnana]|nr:hypothetical protein FQA39_LY04657 [Lamprigera yunnana]